MDRQTVLIHNTYSLLMMAELYTNSSGTFPELDRNWPGTASELPRKDGFTLVPNTFLKGQFLYTVRLIKILFKARDVGTA